MISNSSAEVKLEIGHVLYIDIVGYSKLNIHEQSEQLRTLKQIVRGTDEFKKAEAEGKLLRLPTGDGGALVFRTTPEAPVVCAIEISKALQAHPELKVRMGIHSGPVNEITDLNEQANIAGAGINMAQRVMDCADAGHILLSRHVAEDLEHYPRWQPFLHPLGDCEAKHGQRVGIVNLYSGQIGNPQLPKKLHAVKKHHTRRRWIAITAALFVVATTLAGVAIFSRLGTKFALAAPEKSIAVLPFESLSEDKGNAYLAEGIQDEILTRLSKVADLKVISRTSTQRYKSTPENLPEIAKQLGVAHMLEGSVQKIGDAVRVNVQLIKAANDSHLWADTYVRKITDIFSVESEVARTIADQLRAKLTGTEEKAIADRPTQNTAAYDAYLRGLSTERNHLGFDSATEAGVAYADAVRIDPGFALGWANLAIIRSRLYLYGIDLKTNSAEATREAAERAMTLQPELAEAWAAQAGYRYRVARDFSGAVKAYKEASKRFPNSSHILLEVAVVESRLGDWQKAEVHWRKAMDLDPLNSGLLTAVATEFLGRLRRFSEARALLDRASEISPDDQWRYAERAGLFQFEGQLDEAVKELARVPADSLTDEVVATRADLLKWQRQFDAAIAVMKKKIDSAEPGKPLDDWNKILLTKTAYCQEWAGRSEEAKATFTRALHEIKPSGDAVLAPRGFGLQTYLALIYAGLGEKEKALAEVRLAQQQYANDSWVKCDADQALAEIQARFGDLDAAIAAIPHLLEMPSGITRADLLYNPFWDPLRKDPRFQKLCEENKK